MRLQDFDENMYLSRNLDVAAAVEAGHYASGSKHYETSGKIEGRLAPITLSRRNQNKEFLISTIARLEGWLHDYAALVTMYLLDIQAQRAVGGYLAEIGIYKTKYFSVLLREGRSSGDIVIGVDNFCLVSERIVREIIEEAVPSTNYKLLAMPSTALVADDLKKEADGKLCRFLSIDGSHESEDVTLDLMLADEAICSEGIVAVDDFMNVVNIGVNDGVHRFFAQSRRLVPFAFITNKLLLCRPHMQKLYKESIECYAETDTENEHSKTFVYHRARFRPAVEQKLWGFSLLTIW